MIFWGLLFIIGVSAGLLWVWRQRDHRADQAAMARLAATQPVPARFDPSLVQGLPEPARRFFLYVIAPGTPLYTVATITMEGRFGMGSAADPKYLPMTAAQTLAAPAGFVWKMRARQGLMSVSGSDTEQWTRFWLMGLLPVARKGGDPDHARAAFGRCVAEAVFWTPAAVLPGPGGERESVEGESIEWEGVDGDTARVTVRHNGLCQAVEVTVAADGQPTQVSFARWSDANPEKVYRLQPFGGYLSEFREFAGFRLPTRVEAGNFFGTDHYFPFFMANITRIEFPHA